MTDATPCDVCEEPVTDALARTVQVAVDRSQIDAQRLCPECFAEWVDRYDEEMRAGDGPTDPDDSEIIVD